MTGKETSALVDKGPVPKIVAAGEKGGAATTLPNVEGQPSKSERGKALRQVIAAFIANIGTINTGLIFGFSAVVIPQLQAPDTLIPVDESQSSWVGKWSFFFKCFQRLVIVNLQSIFDKLSSKSCV
ncbi:uncharacterized protein LOC129755448 [Uranotaenia lowii]|uniref:uncharacterized protein LOC129755448 n=1 Tax=Uranotaenia lowii TaxID=190385 RepID=UPI002479991C|nr:uncharacterized protein LOC129755448 [Uranotaenia lowii]